MATLTNEQILFLEKQSIPLVNVCDISGMSTKDYKVFMKEKCFIIGYGGTPCKKSGHTLRMRHGHCAQCNTQAIAITQRKSMKGYLYVAVSFRRVLVKVGVAKDYKNRNKTLNSSSYGNINDWNIIAVYEGDNIGEIENLIHNAFSNRSIKIVFMKDNKLVEASEIIETEVGKVLTEIDNFSLNTIKLDKKNIELFDECYLIKNNSEITIENTPCFKEEIKVLTSKLTAEKLRTVKNTDKVSQNKLQNNEVDIFPIKSPMASNEIIPASSDCSIHPKLRSETLKTEKNKNAKVESFSGQSSQIVLNHNLNSVLDSKNALTMNNKQNKIKDCLYVVVSLKKLIIKVGITNSYEQIVEQLNCSNYGNTKDWILVALYKDNKNSKNKKLIYKVLSNEVVKINFVSKGEVIESTEVIHTNVNRVLNIIDNLSVEKIKLDKDVIGNFDAILLNNAYKKKGKELNIEFETDLRNKNSSSKNLVSKPKYKAKKVEITKKIANQVYTSESIVAREITPELIINPTSKNVAVGTVSSSVKSVRKVKKRRSHIKNTRSSSNMKSVINYRPNTKHVSSSKKSNVPVHKNSPLRRNHKAFKEVSKLDIKFYKMCIVLLFIIFFIYIIWFLSKT